MYVRATTIKIGIDIVCEMSRKDYLVLFTKIIVTAVHIHIAVEELEAIGVADGCPQEVVGVVGAAALLQLESPGVGILRQVGLAANDGLQRVPFVLVNAKDKVVTAVRLQVLVEAIEDVDIDNLAYQLLVHAHLL